MRETMETTQNNSEQNMNILQMIHNDLVNHDSLKTSLVTLVTWSSLPTPNAATVPSPFLRRPPALSRPSPIRGRRRLAPAIAAAAAASPQNHRHSMEK